MKKLIFILFALAISLALQAQNAEQFFNELTGKYADKDGFSASMLTSDMFDLYLKKKKVDENSEVAAALKKLDRIMVVSQSKVMAAFIVKSDDKKSEEPNKLHNELLQHYQTGSGYTLLKTEKRMGEDVKVYLKKSNEKVTSLALVTNSSAATGLVELDGDIDLASVASLSSALNLRGLENLYKIDNSGPVTVIGYPSAEYFDQERLAEIEARAREMAEKHEKLSEEQLKRIQEQAEMQAQKQMELAEKQRQMIEVYQRQPIFLNAPGDSVIYYLNGKKVTVDEIKNLKNGDIQTIDVSKADKKDHSIIRITTK